MNNLLTSFLKLNQQMSQNWENFDLYAFINSVCWLTSAPYGKQHYQRKSKAQFK